MKHFFVVGLPRSRSAWLANFLTTEGAICFHEALRTVSTLEELGRSLKVAATQYRIVGDADPSLTPHLPQVAGMFPHARFVFVVRDLGDALASHQRAFPKLGVDRQGFERLKDQLEQAADALDATQCLHVNYDKLDRDDICNQIHEFCLGRPMDRRRWLMLNELRVTAIAEKAAVTFAPWVRTAISQVAYPVTPASKEWDALMAEICGERLDVRQWLADLWDLTMTWDHLVDGDPMDVWRAERAFEAIVLQWPFNVFWQKHGPLLSPVLSNALAAWRTDERERHYDIYSETARAVAFCLGGQARVKQFSPRVQSAVKGLLMEDNERDGQ